MAQVPTIKLIGPAGTVVVNRGQKEAEYRAKGYRAEGEEASAPASSKKSSSKKFSSKKKADSGDEE